MVLCIPLFWIKFSGAVQELKEELMIVNCNGEENGSTIKGGAFFVERDVGKAAVSMRGGDQESRIFD